MLSLDLKDVEKRTAELLAVREQEAQASVARLLATENIHVQFQPVRTASFNTLSRVLTIPIFSKELLRATISMFIGHEVGHALITPQDGWEKSRKASKAVGHGKNWKDYLNVAEDVRVDRFIKRKYPGILKDYFIGYTDLFKKGFFGDPIQLRARLSTMLLVDRINLYYKAGPALGAYGFDDEALRICKLAYEAVTFEDVIEVATQIEAYDISLLNAMEEAAEAAQQNLPDDDGEGEDQDDMGDGSFEDDSEEGESGPSGEGDDEEAEDDLSDMDGPQESSGNPSDDKSDDDEDADEGDGEGDLDDDDAEEGSEKGGASGEKDEAVEEEEADKVESTPPSGKFQPGSKGDAGTLDETTPAKMPRGAPKSITQEAFADRQDELLDRSAQQNSYYQLEIPAKPRDYIISYKEIQKGFHRRVTDSQVSADAASISRTLLTFKEKHGTYINHLVREFELKKNATQFARASEAKMGILNLNKMHQYKYNDDLFKKISIVPQGKNHGFMMIIDLSGSMQDILPSVIEQALVLAVFCRKVNIPFRVYGFTDGSWSWRNWIDPNYVRSAHEKAIQVKGPDKICFDHDFGLVEFFSERMSLSEFNYALHCMTKSYLYYMHLPLSGTPLNEAILVIPEVVKMFRGETNAEKITAMILTDGQSNGANLPYGKTHGGKMYIRNPWNSKIYELGANGNSYHYGRQTMNATKTYLQMVKDVTGINLIGYHVGTGRVIGRMLTEYYGFYTKTPEQMRTQFRQDKFMSIDQFGYDEYFLMWEGAFKEEDGNMDSITSQQSVRKMAATFQKVLAKRSLNRVFLGKFIKLVA